MNTNIKPIDYCYLFEFNPTQVGRYCDLKGIEEIKDLHPGMVFSKPEYRREVFLRFYEFHLKYRAHPGAVYYMFDYLSEKFNLTFEQRLWLAYINGCSQNIITSWLVFTQFPDVKDLKIDTFNSWFRNVYDKLGWDTDRRYVKNSFDKCIENYQYNLNGRNQVDFFESLAYTNDKFENFRNVWNKVINDFHLFGRLSTFSYLEYLRIVGLNIDCDSLFLDDMSGSKSHRNGLAKVLGRDDLDWHDKLNPHFDGKYTIEVLEWLKKEGELLLEDSRQRIDHKDVSYFTLESTLCCFKSWHRKNRRYPNVYNDMFYNRIKYAEDKWQKPFTLFWDARKQYLPKYLRVENNPNDPGLVPEKQNIYRDTGQVIMMDLDWPCFINSFNKNNAPANIEEFI